MPERARGGGDTLKSRNPAGDALSVVSMASALAVTLALVACSPTGARTPSATPPPQIGQDTAAEPAEWLPRAMELLHPPPPPEPRMRYPVTGRVDGERFGEVSGEASCVEGGKFSVDAAGAFAFEAHDEPCRLNVFLRYDGMLARGPELPITRADATGVRLQAPRRDELVPNDAQIALLRIAEMSRRSNEHNGGGGQESLEHAELLEHHVRRARERRGLE